MLDTVLLDSTTETSENLGFLEVSLAGINLNMIIRAGLILVISLIVIRLILRIFDRAFSRMDLDQTLKRIIRVSLKSVLLFIMIILILNSLNISVASFVVVLSVAGVAASLALQNLLTNVAGGFQLMASKPFKVGDYVETGGCAGTIKEIGLIYTKMTSIDNKLIQLPNSTIISETITNYSSEETRRVEWKVTASYEADTEHVKAVLTRMVGEHPLTLATPEPIIRVSQYGENSIEYVVRAWCASQDYWTVYYDLMDAFKPEFDREHIEMTYPHVNVHFRGAGELPQTEHTDPG